MKNFKLYIPLFIIVIISLLTLYNYDINYFFKQVIWVVSGFSCLFGTRFFKTQKFFRYSKYLYYFNLLLLLLVLFIGKEINGAKAWFTFKYFSFQPSELMKFSIALYLTNIFSEKNKHYYLKSILVLLTPSFLVFLEPDTGAIIMYLVIYLAALFYSLKNKKIFYIFCISVFALGLIFFYLYLTNIDLLVKLLGTSIFYRIDRLLNFKNNYQLENALISIGTANFCGRKKPSIYIPESITDFIFARVVANFGFVTGIITIVCYFFVLYYLIININKSKKGMLTFIFLWLFLFQLAQNILMNLGLVPIMGISLPFLSYGGSNTIIYFMFMSLIVNKKKICS